MDDVELLAHRLMLRNANGRVVIKYKGIVILRTGDEPGYPKIISLNHTFFVPSMPYNIFSTLPILWEGRYVDTADKFERVVNQRAFVCDFED